MSLNKNNTHPWKMCHHLQSPEKDASCPCGYRGGIWGVEGETMVLEMGSTVTEGHESLTIPRYKREIEIQNAHFIIEASEVLSECGLTPRELLEQNRELLEALKNAVKFIKLSPDIKYDRQPKGLEKWEKLTAISK